MTINDWSDEGFEEFRHRNLGYMRFCEALDDNRLSAGMTLTQSQLSIILDISLSPLRETLILLEENGLVEIKPRAGIRIFYPEVTFIRENMQFRSMIEIFAMQVFVRNVSEEWLADMHCKHLELRAEWQASKHARDTQSESKSRLLDRLFHGGIVEPLGNEAIQETHKRVIHNVHIARKVHQTSFGKTHYLDTIDEHLRILDAVKSGDTEKAIEALEAHFQTATHRLFIAP